MNLLPATRRVILTKHALFDENSIPCYQENSTQTNKAAERETSVETNQQCSVQMPICQLNIS